MFSFNSIMRIGLALLLVLSTAGCSNFLLDPLLDPSNSGTEQSVDTINNFPDITAPTSPIVTTMVGEPVSGDDAAAFSFDISAEVI